MGKRDLTKTKEANTINSRSARKTEHEKAISNLEKAKKLNRKTVFLKQGEGEYSKSLQKSDDQEEMFSTRDAAKHLGMPYHSFARLQTKLKLPFIKKRNAKFFKVSDLEKYKDQILNV